MPFLTQTSRFHSLGLILTTEREVASLPFTFALGRQYPMEAN